MEEVFILEQCRLQQSANNLCIPIKSLQVGEGMVGLGVGEMVLGLGVGEGVVGLGVGEVGGGGSGT